MLAGDVPGDHIVVEHLRGEVDGLTTEDDGEPKIGKGDEVVMFLGLTSEGTLTPWGGYQGVATIGEDGSLLTRHATEWQAETLGDLRMQVSTEVDRRAIAQALAAGPGLCAGTVVAGAVGCRPKEYSVGLEATNLTRRAAAVTIQGRDHRVLVSVPACSVLVGRVSWPASNASVLVDGAVAWTAGEDLDLAGSGAFGVSIESHEVGVAALRDIGAEGVRSVGGCR